MSKFKQFLNEDPLDEQLQHTNRILTIEGGRASRGPLAVVQNGFDIDLKTKPMYIGIQDMDLRLDQDEVKQYENFYYDKVGEMEKQIRKEYDKMFSAFLSKVEKIDDKCAKAVWDELESYF